jgi:hypothetical protein
MPKSRVVCAAALLIVLPLLAAAQEPVNIAFTVAVSRPHTHLFEIEIAVKRAANGPQQELLVMPVWTPGSYMIRAGLRRCRLRGEPTQVGKDEQEHVASVHQRRSRMASELPCLRERAVSTNE